MMAGSRNRNDRCRRGAARLLLTILVLAVSLACVPMEEASARDPGAAKRAIAALQGYEKPLRIGVIGDSAAGDLSRGMQKLLRQNGAVDIVPFTRPATGLMRDDIYDWPEAIAKHLRTSKLDIVAVMIGGNDRQSVWVGGTRLVRGTPPWRAELERRVKAFMDVLAAAKVRVYWVGLPIVRSDAMNRDYKIINAVFRAQAAKHGFTYLDTWSAFADGTGRYSSFGPDIHGVRRQLRQGDGIHFSVAGELRLAQIVAHAIGRDLGKIKSSH